MYFACNTQGWETRKTEFKCETWCSECQTKNLTLFIPPQTEFSESQTAKAWHFVQSDMLASEGRNSTALTVCLDVVESYMQMDSLPAPPKSLICFPKRQTSFNPCKIYRAFFFLMHQVGFCRVIQSLQRLCQQQLFEEFLSAPRC